MVPCAGPQPRVAGTWEGPPDASAQAPQGSSRYRPRAAHCRWQCNHGPNARANRAVGSGWWRIGVAGRSQRKRPRLWIPPDWLEMTDARTLIGCAPCRSFWRREGPWPLLWVRVRSFPGEATLVRPPRLLVGPLIPLLHGDYFSLFTVSLYLETNRNYLLKHSSVWCKLWAS